jgi:hypothetical protein
MAFIYEVIAYCDCRYGSTQQLTVLRTWTHFEDDCVLVTRPKPCVACLHQQELRAQAAARAWAGSG